MELFLSFTALCAFSLLPAGAPVLLRCGLSACLRFSPRAALALSSVAALSACTAMLLCRGGLRAVPHAQCSPAALAGMLGGTMGRMLLLMFTARFSGSLELARAQAAPLVLLAASCLLPFRFPFPGSRAGLFAFSLLCALSGGFFGCGETALFILFTKHETRRKIASLQGAALLCSIMAQSCALLLTLLSGAAQVFPIRTLLILSASAALGGVIFERMKKRSPLQKGLRVALCLYMLLSALSGAEQAFFV